MGMIYKRGKTYWIKYYRSGKPYRESTRSKKEADAKRLLKRREGEISQGKLPGIYFDRVRFDELAEDFLRDYRINGKKSLRRAQESVDHLKRAFEGARVPDITTPRIQAYIEQRLLWACNQCGKPFAGNIEDPACPHCDSEDVAKGAANGTINRELAALKRMLNLGAQQTPSRVDRVPHIPMLKENNTRKGFFEQDQFEAVRDALPEYLKGFATVAYHTGWRLGEIAGLTWAQVDREIGTIRLEAGTTKNDEARIVYMTDEVREVIERRWAERDNLLPYVFLNSNGTDKVKRFDKAWKRACKDSAIGPRWFHDFRRTAVRDMDRAGVSQVVGMKISGHKTDSVYRRYNIVSDSDLRLAAQKHQEYLKNEKGTVSGTTHDFQEKRANRSSG